MVTGLCDYLGYNSQQTYAQVPQQAFGIVGGLNTAYTGGLQNAYANIFPQPMPEKIKKWKLLTALRKEIDDWHGDIIRK